MDMEQKYSNLWSFFSAYLEDFDCDDDIAIVREFGIKNPVPAVSKVLQECLELQKEKPFPWEEVSNQANRYFSQEIEAYEWFEEILLELISVSAERIRMIEES